MLQLFFAVLLCVQPASGAYAIDASSNYDSDYIGSSVVNEGKISLSQSAEYDQLNSEFEQGIEEFFSEFLRQSASGAWENANPIPGVFVGRLILHSSLCLMCNQ